MQSQHSRNCPRAGLTSQQVYVVFATNDEDGEFANCIKEHTRCTKLLKANESEEKTVPSPAQLPFITVLPLMFVGTERKGDIEWMNSQPEYKSYLYVVPDNPQITAGPVFFTRLRGLPNYVPIEYIYESQRTGEEKPITDALRKIEAKLRANGQYTTVCYPADRLSDLNAMRVEIPPEDRRKFPQELQKLAREINGKRGYQR